jgi:tetratricopeptide (TPR) repeat protein
MISLRAYNREIEQLIDNGLYDEAIAHSIHILTTFPKCIDSYRNLGKSLLEQKKYTEALDVFSRVLSAIPDDFISHVGLSIIFEDQNSLDLAIWHMEQAFDVQPSNLAIQDELKRLFGLRDGEQPIKIRLTRGALVRMYARGELFQQAVTEILSILQEDPRRIDLEVILARMQYFSGALEESSEVCTRILEKVPFCFEANQILQQIHINKNESEAATINFNRLISLDPYYQFRPSPFSDKEIPENKVLLEKLDYIPSIASNVQIPAWLEDIEASSDGKPKESFNWLSDLNQIEVQTSNSAVDPFILNNQAAENNAVNNDNLSDDIIPDWMKTAGWKTNLDSETENPFETPNVNNYESKSLITEGQSSDIPTNNLPDFGSIVTNDDLASLFTELKEGKMGTDNLEANGNEEKQFPPADWMSQFSNSEEPATTSSSDQDFPDWLKNFQAEEPLITQDSEDMPDWLKNLQSEVEPTLQTENELPIEASIDISEPEETTFDNIIVQTEKEDEIKTSDEGIQSSSDQEDGWEKIDLAETSVENFNEPALVEGEPSQIISDDKIPDWVKSVLINQNSNEQLSPSEGSEIISNSKESQSSDNSSELPNTAYEVNEATPESEEGIISQQTNDELLDWLRGLKTEEEPLTQTEEEINPFESIYEPSGEIDVETNKEDLDSGALGTPNVLEDLGVEVKDHFIQLEESLESVPNEDEFSLTTIVNQDQPDNIDDFVTDSSTEVYKNNGDDGQVEKIQTSELRIEPVLENSEDNVIDEIKVLINKGDFDNLATKLSQIVVHDQIVSTIVSAETEHGDNFAYWQCLGDLYSKDNRLNDALFAYQKAEDILVKTIS